MISSPLDLLKNLFKKVPGSPDPVSDWIQILIVTSGPQKSLTSPILSGPGSGYLRLFFIALNDRILLSERKVRF